MLKIDYEFIDGSWGFTNCSLCDDDVMCNEYKRWDGLKVWLCKKCEDKNYL